MGNVRLVQFTDTHLVGDRGARLRDVATQPSLEACVARAAARHLPADAILVTGDVAHDDPGGYSALARILGPLDTPVRVIPGNHDVPAEMRRHLDGTPSFTIAGDLRVGAWTVVLLETWMEGSVDGEGRLGDAELARLDRTLAENRGRPVLVCLHHPPLPMDDPGLDELGLLDADAFHAVLARHDNVRGVLWGHAHQGFDLQRGEIRWMCTPSTCMQFEPRSGRFVVDDRPPGYRVLDLMPDGGLASEIAWLEGYCE